MFTARYGLIPYIKQITVVFKGLIQNVQHSWKREYICRSSWLQQDMTTPNRLRKKRKAVLVCQQYVRKTPQNQLFTFTFRALYRQQNNLRYTMCRKLGPSKKKIPYPYQESNRGYLIHARRFNYWLNVFRIVCSDVSSGKFLTPIRNQTADT